MVLKAMMATMFSRSETVASVCETLPVRMADSQDTSDTGAGGDFNIDMPTPRCECGKPLTAGAVVAVRTVDDERRFYCMDCF